MKPPDVKSSTYLDFGVENSDKDPKLKAGYHVIISKGIYVNGQMLSVF